MNAVEDIHRVQCGWTRTSITNELEPVVTMQWHYRRNGTKFPSMDINWRNVHPSYLENPGAGVTIDVYEASCSGHEKIIFEKADELSVDTFTNDKGVKCLMVTLKQPAEKLPEEE